MPCNNIAKAAYQGPESVTDDPYENGMMQVDFLPQKPLIAKELDNTFVAAIAAEETIAPAMDVNLDPTPPITMITMDADVVVNHDTPEEFMVQKVHPSPQRAVIEHRELTNTATASYVEPEITPTAFYVGHDAPAITKDVDIEKSFALSMDVTPEEPAPDTPLMADLESHPIHDESVSVASSVNHTIDISPAETQDRVNLLSGVELGEQEQQVDVFSNVDLDAIGLFNRIGDALNQQQQLPQLEQQQQDEHTNFDFSSTNEGAGISEFAASALVNALSSGGSFVHPFSDTIASPFANRDAPHQSFQQVSDSTANLDSTENLPRLERAGTQTLPFANRKTPSIQNPNDNNIPSVGNDWKELLRRRYPGFDLKSLAFTDRLNIPRGMMSRESKNY